VNTRGKKKANIYTVQTDEVEWNSDQKKIRKKVSFRDTNNAL